MRRRPEEALPSSTPPIKAIGHPHITFSRGQKNDWGLHWTMSFVRGEGRSAFAVTDRYDHPYRFDSKEMALFFAETPKWFAWTIDKGTRPIPTPEVQ